LEKYVTQAFLDAGTTVIGTSRKIQQSDFSSSSFTALPAEISRREDAQGLVYQGAAPFGTLDVLAHTMGGFAGGQSMADTDDATFHRMFDLNLNSLFHVLVTDRLCIFFRLRPRARLSTDRSCDSMLVDVEVVGAGTFAEVSALRLVGTAPYMANEDFDRVFALETAQALMGKTSRRTSKHYGCS
jgi:hypothetical protein